MSDYLPSRTDRSTALLMQQQPWIRPRQYWDGCERYEMYCYLCYASLSDPAADSTHLKGKTHLKRIQWPLSYWKPPERDPWENTIRNSLCQVVVPVSDEGRSAVPAPPELPPPPGVPVDEVQRAWASMVEAAEQGAHAGSSNDGDNMKALAHESAEMKLSIAEVQASVAEVKASVAEVKTSIAEIEWSDFVAAADLQALKSEVVDMKASIEEIKLMLASISTGTVLTMQ